MKNLKFLFYLSIILIAFVSCKINNTIAGLENVEKIEFISYADRIMWDTISYNHKNPFKKELINKNNQLTFDTLQIKERIVLNKEQKEELFDLLNSNCYELSAEDACYMPRHLILFRDKTNKIIAYNEFCFTCGNAINSNNLDNYQNFCLNEMEALFKKNGIKYFVNTPEDETKEHNQLKEKGLLNY